MQNEQPLNTIQFTDDSINIREEIEKYLYHWKWFVLGVVLAVSSAFVYLRYTPNKYEVSTTILVDDGESSGMASELAAFEDLGLLSGSKISLENEIELLKSINLLERVVKDLELNVAYYRQGRVIETELFKERSPLKITFLTKEPVFYSKDTVFTVLVTSKETFALKNSEKKVVSESVFGERVHTSLGDITVTPMQVDKIIKGDEIIVKVRPLKSVIDSYKNRIQIQPVNKSSSVIKLSLKDPVKQKAQVILDRLVTHYNNDAIAYKSLVAKNTETFINKRLEIITKDLFDVEKEVEQFKTKNKLTDIAAEANLVLQSNVEIENKLLDLNTQLTLVTDIERYMAENKDDLIPANLGLTDVSINAGTEQYNQLVLERNRILQSSSAQNPVIVNLNAQIKKIRASIVKSIANLKSSLTIALKNVKRQENRMSSKIASVPQQEREYRDIKRQQQIIESLYLYLLQKREENAISLAVTLPNAKIIDKAYGSNIPVAPKRKVVYLAALLLGIIVPFGVIYLLLLFDNKVHTRKDVEAVVKAPILGDIPKTKTDKKVVVSDHDRTSVSESFRLLRTNINFMLSKVTEKSKVIFVTSTVGGEGKTFISINLATVLALSGKKVLLIGADIRKPKISDYLGVVKGKGLTHFLMDKTIQPVEIIEKVDEHHFDMIHSGIIAPNPSELLMNNRFNEVIAYGKQHYDYVIVDTAPVNIVTDTLLLGDKADLFIYVVRANYLDKRLLEFPQILHRDQRLPNMSILINDVDAEKGYGYSYGYGYGYGYSEKKTSWFKKRFT